MTEAWKPVLGGYYAVSNHGRVTRLLDRVGRPLPHPRFLRPDVTGDYAQVSLFVDGARRRRKVHLLVAEVFIGPCPLGNFCDHVDGVKLNNHVSNLEYVTRQENSTRAAKKGLYRRGSMHYKSRATDAIVSAIRARYRPGNGAALGREFGLARQTVHHIVHANTWKHI